MVNLGQVTKRSEHMLERNACHFSVVYMPVTGVTMGFENDDLDSTLRTLYPIRDSVAVDTDHGAAGGHWGTPPTKRNRIAGLCFGGSSF